MAGHYGPGQIGDVDLRLLRVFRAVVESGGFAQAEVALNVSASAISISMAELEKRLGLCLCQRGRAGFSLTEEGRQVYQSCLQLFASLEAFRGDIYGLHQQLCGEFAIGITDNLVTSPQMRVTHALQALKVQGPQVRIHIRMMPPAEVEQALLDGKLDVGVVPQLNPLKGLHYQRLYDETSLLYCSDEHPLFSSPATLDIAELEHADAVEPGFTVPAPVHAQYQRLNTTAKASDREGIAFLILTGLYIGFLPEHFAERWVAQGRMRVLLPACMHQSVPYAAVTRKGVKQGRAAAVFLAALAQDGGG